MKKVLILPFAPSKADDPQAWVGKAILQSLTADLSIDPALRISEGSDPAADVKTAQEAGRLAEVQTVIFGSFQTVDDQIRITGQIVDVETGTAKSGLKATGRVQDLFALEDSLVHQVKNRLLKPAWVQKAAAQAPLPAIKDDDPIELGIRAPGVADTVDWLEPADRTPLYGSSAAGAAYRYYYSVPWYSYSSYGYYGYPNYYSGYYPRNCYRGYGYSGLSISGRYTGDNFSAAFRIGGYPSYCPPRMGRSLPAGGYGAVQPRGWVDGYYTRARGTVPGGMKSTQNAVIQRR